MYIYIYIYTHTRSLERGPERPGAPGAEAPGTVAEGPPPMELLLLVVLL